LAYQVKLAALQSRILRTANLEGAGAFIPPEELTDSINESIAEWVDEVRGTTWNGTYSRSSYTFTTNPSGTPQQVYALPPDFLALLSVDVYVAGGSPVQATAYQEEQRNALRGYSITSGWSSASPVYYQLQAGNISFLPIPQGSYSVTLNYVPTAPTLSDPDDYIDSINGWEAFIVIDAAIKCLIKAGEDAAIPALEARLARQRERIRAMAPTRDQQTAERVHVVMNAGPDEWDW
jgi:hypothetical protein